MEKSATKKTLAQIRARDRDIYFLYKKAHKTLGQIAEIYGISRGRVHQIVKMEQARNRSSRLMDNPTLIGRMVYGWQHLDNNFPEGSTGTVRSTMNCLARAWRVKAEGNNGRYRPAEFLNWMMSLDYNTGLKIRNIGVKKFGILMRIQEDIQKSDKTREILLKNCTAVY